MTQALQLKKMNLPVVQDGMQAYMQRINQIPLLTPEEEHELAMRFQTEGDLQAAQQLVLSNLRFVASIARQYMGYGLAFGDLVQEGTIGLMKAVKRFDPKVGVRLVAFAVHWIKSEIHEYVIRNWRIVKVATTKSQRKLFFNLRSQKDRLGWFSKEEVESVAKDLGVSPKDVLEMESRLNAHDAAFDAPHEEEGETYTHAPQQYLESNEVDPLHALEDGNLEDHRQMQLSLALENLDERSLEVLKARYLIEQKTPLKELAEKYGISVERVRQIEKAAIEKIKAAVSEE